MSGTKRSHGSDFGLTVHASFLIHPCIVRVSDDITNAVIPSSCLERSTVLSQAQREAADTGCRVPTSFSVEQVELWASYTRMPRVFMTQSTLLHILAVLEVADMLDDSRTVTSMCETLAYDYVAPFVPEGFDDSDEAGFEADGPAGHGRTHPSPGPAQLRAGCKSPQPQLTIRNAFLWGAGLVLQEECGRIGPADLEPHTSGYRRERQALARRNHRHPQTPAAVDCPEAKPGTAAVFMALGALPEHLLLRVLRSWAAGHPKQLATLPRRLHAAAVAAAHPSVDSTRSVSLVAHGPQTFRRALRAVTALGSTRRIDSVSLHPPQIPFRRQNRSECVAAMRAVAHHLCHLSAITSVCFTGMQKALIKGDGMRGPECIASMPHLRRVGFADVACSLVPQLVCILTRMQKLHELSLAITEVPLLVDGGWGGVGPIQQLTALTTLQAVNLKITIKTVHIPGCERCTAEAAAALLRAVEDKRVDIMQTRFCWEGTRPAAGVLGTLRATAPQLDLARCVVEERGDGVLRQLGTAEAQVMWGALTCGPGVAVTSLAVEFVRAGVRVASVAPAMHVSPAVLGDLPRVEKLRVMVPEGSLLGRRAATAFRWQLHKLQHLRTLELPAALSRRAAQMLLPRLSTVTALQTLDLEGNCLGADGGEALAAGLRGLNALQELLLYGNDLGERGAASVMAALTPIAAAGLKQLDLGLNRIGPGGAAALAARLPDMSALADLRLEANDFAGGEALRVFQRSLAGRGVRLTALSRLHLGRNFLECSGAAALADTLPHFPNLSTLDMHATAVGAQGMRALVRRIGRTPITASLCVHLQHNCIGDAGAKALARVLRQRTAQRESLANVRFDVERNGIGDRGALALAGAVFAAVECGVGVCGIDLAGNEVSVRMWNRIFNCTKRWNSRLQRPCGPFYVTLCAGMDHRHFASREHELEMMAA